jgi:hypothetical protein
VNSPGAWLSEGVLEVLAAVGSEPAVTSGEAGEAGVSIADAGAFQARPATGVVQEVASRTSVVSAMGISGARRFRA